MSGPFRDELATAHATIARLEGEIRDLKTELAKPRPKVPWGMPSPGMFFIIVAFLATGVFAIVCTFVARMRHVASDRDYRGVALAPHDSIPPPIDPGPHADSKRATLEPASSDPSGKPGTKCNCTPGDPLCSCL